MKGRKISRYRVGGRPSVAFPTDGDPDAAAKSRPPPSGNSNLLLARLPAADYARLLSSLDVIPLKLKEVLQPPGEPVQYVFFPGGGFASVLTTLEDGGMVEVATIGREGMVGAFAAIDGDTPSMSMTPVRCDGSRSGKARSGVL